MSNDKTEEKDAAGSTRHFCEGCGKAATMQCPTCTQLNPPSRCYFCSQTCFKANWATHKVCHTKIAEYVPWPNYKFTGPLRPYPRSGRRAIPPHIEKPDYADHGEPISEKKERGSNKIRVLDASEIVQLKAACKITREVLDIAAAALRPGITTEEIDLIVFEATVERNAYPSPLNYFGFPKSCCTSVNEVICHGIPDRRPLQDGDIVNLDISCYYQGFHGDVNATYCIGNVDEAGRKLVNTTRECLEKAIALVKPGVAYRDLGEVIQAHAESNGFSVVRTYCGHGIHNLFHSAPSIPHYASTNENYLNNFISVENKAVGTMKPGHVFTIEPMINEGVYQDEHWLDNWTAVTRDGKRSAQFEHTMIVTETGVEILT